MKDTSLRVKPSHFKVHQVAAVHGQSRELWLAVIVQVDAGGQKILVKWMERMDKEEKHGAKDIFQLTQAVEYQPTKVFICSGVQMKVINKFNQSQFISH
jgi:hypothetical protein